MKARISNVCCCAYGDSNVRRSTWLVVSPPTPDYCAALISKLQRPQGQARVHFKLLRKGLTNLLPLLLEPFHMHVTESSFAVFARPQAARIGRVPLLTVQQDPDTPLSTLSACFDRNPSCKHFAGSSRGSCWAQCRGSCCQAASLQMLRVASQQLCAWQRAP